MITYTAYSEAGGVKKTTTSVNLARAHADQGLETLVIDIDPQEGSLSYLLDIDDGRNDRDHDNLVRHILDRPTGEFEDLIVEIDEGFDAIPTHDMWASFQDLLEQKRDYEEQMATSESGFEPFAQLQETLADAGIYDTYDVVIVDPQATAGPALFNAIMATQNLVMPVEPSGKGSKSIEGLQMMVRNLEEKVNIEVGVVALVPSGVSDTRTHNSYVDELEDSGFAVPTVIRERASMMQEMWDAHGSAYKVVEEEFVEGEPGERRSRDSEINTLYKYDDLAEYIAEDFDVQLKPEAA